MSMATEDSTKPVNGDLSANRKSLREMVASVLPIWVGMALATHGVDAFWAAAIAIALVGIASRGYRVLRKYAPWLTWLLGNDGPPPAGLD